MAGKLKKNLDRVAHTDAAWSLGDKVWQIVGPIIGGALMTAFATLNANVAAQGLFGYGVVFLVAAFAVAATFALAGIGYHLVFGHRRKVVPIAKNPDDLTLSAPHSSVPIVASGEPDWTIKQEDIVRRFGEISDRIDKIERNTTFNNQKLHALTRDVPLLASYIQMHAQASLLLNCVPTMPELPNPPLLSGLNPDQIQIARGEYENYCRAVKAVLAGTQWEYELRVAETAGEVDGEHLTQSVPPDRVPEGMDRLALRPFMLAMARAARVSAFIHAQRDDAMRSYREGLGRLADLTREKYQTDPSASS